MTDGHSSANAILQSLGKKTWYHFRFIQSLFSALDLKWYVISFGYSDIQADSKKKNPKKREIPMNFMGMAMAGGVLCFTYKL